MLTAWIEPSSNNGKRHLLHQTAVLPVMLMMD
jgi:hypothetical protein